MTSTALQIHNGEPGSALAPAQPRLGLLRPLAQPSEVIQAQEETRAMVHEALKEGRDYGKIPGVDKPSLLKPGAERICSAFGTTPRFTVVGQEVDHDRVVPWRKVKAKYEGPQGNRRKVGEEVTTGESYGLYRYVVLCEIVHRESGQVVGSSIGSCSTMESKYIDRPRDCENTVLKMSQKRSHVGATLNAFGLSEQFTQDVEDLPREVVGGAAAATDDDGVKCPKCSGAMWDNREKNDEREKAGQKRMPDYKCKDDKNCTTVIWDAAKYAAELAGKEGQQPQDPTSAPTSSGQPVSSPAGTVTDAPCPVCAGAMWNQSTTKTNVRAPDYVCQNTSCEGKYWPGMWPPKPAATDEQLARLRELNDHPAIPTRTRTAVAGYLENGIKAHRAAEAIEKLEKLIAEAPKPEPSLALGVTPLEDKRGSLKALLADELLQPQVKAELRDQLERGELETIEALDGAIALAEANMMPF